MGAVALALFALAALAAVVFAPPPPAAPLYEGSGAGRPQRGGTFVFHHETNVRSLDPHTAFDELSSMAIRLLFDGLLDYDEHTRLVPSLAAQMPEQSSDGLRFTFRLREGVRFHNGRELEAEDVRFSLEHMLHPDVPSQGSTYYQGIAGLEDFRERRTEHISGIRVVDRHTVEITLSAPDQTFLAAMAMPFAYPVAREAYEGEGADPAFRPIGTGPYTLDEWERGVRLTFERFDGYWQPGKPYVDRMVYLENLTRDVAVMRFRNGDLDAAHRFSPADYLFFSGSAAWRPQVIRDAKVNLWGFAMNTELPPFDDVHVRRAVASAMDRAGWSRARSGRLRETGQPIPPGLLGYDADTTDQHRYDLARAREEMQLAGLPDGWPEEVVLWNTSSDTSRFYAELAQADLARIGIRLRINALSFATWLEETGKPRTAQCMLAGWNMDFPDPSNFLDSLFHSRSAREANSTNRAFYRNPALDALLDRARVEPDLGRREQMYRDASRLLVQDAPWAFMWNDEWLEVTQPYVRGYRMNKVFSQDYRFVWLDLPRRRIARRYGAHLPRGLAGIVPLPLARGQER